jgi:hypothetical protein
MKKILLSLIAIPTLLLGLFQTANAQTRSLDFSVQASDMIVSHDAKLFPNPVTDGKFKVQSDDVIKVVEVINVIGQSVHKQRNETLSPDALEIQLLNCEKGMYLVKVTFEDDKSIIKKLLVK